MTKDGRGDTHCYSQRGNLRERDHLSPNIRAMAWRILRTRERDVCKPSDVGTGIGQQSSPKTKSAAHIDVVTEGVETGKGDVAGSAHQRHDVHTESLKHHGHGEQEDHGRAVHGEDLVIEVRS